MASTSPRLSLSKTYRTLRHLSLLKATLQINYLVCISINVKSSNLSTVDNPCYPGAVALDVVSEAASCEQAPAPKIPFP